MDEVGRALFLNRSVRGAVPDDVEGKLLEQFLSPDRAIRIRAMLEEARTTGNAVVDKTVRIDALDGSERWFIEKCVPFQESDESSRFLLVRTEQTHLRRAEEELRASEVRYRTLFESNPDPVIVVSGPSLEIVAANPAAVRLYGFSEEELHALEWAMLFHEDEREGVRATFASASGERRRTARQRRRDGTVIVTDIVDNPIVFNGVAARIAVVRDRTERELLEAQLRHAQKMEAMGVFAGGIAHDFNNLLGVISGCAQGVREVVPEGSNASEDLESLEDAVVRGANLTKKLMLFCRRFSTTRELLDLTRVIDDLGIVLRRLLGERVKLAVVHGATSAPCMGDQTELEQLLSNLVLNAGQAGSRLIVVRTKVLDVDASWEARLPRARPGRYVELSVEDDGHGIDEPAMHRIFEPFFTTKASGTGLGLAVVHGVVERHEGHLYARSKPGVGTTICVYLPLAPAPASTVDAKAPAQRVLFADDDDALRRLTERMLRRLGYDVVSARDGEEALRVFEKTPEAFDFVLLDVLMPKLKGPDAFARMRAIRPELEALFVSGYVGAHPSDTSDGAEPLRILHKPFTAAQLGAALQRLAMKSGEAK
ncbi:MAG: PAS domain S-box protein [Labilithrix sp.]|nr:PAS domain S-box protein [Labilithrix sp.]